MPFPILTPDLQQTVDTAQQSQAPAIAPAIAPADGNPLASLNLGPAPQPVAPTATATATDAKPKTFREKLASALNANPIATSEPGAWAKSLVGGAVTALHPGSPTNSKVGGLVNGVTSALGDSANVQLKPGQGWLAGLEQTSANRSARIAKQQQDAATAQTEEQKNQASIAHENVQTYLQQRLVQKMTAEDETARDKDIETGTQSMQPFVTGKYSSPVLAEDVSAKDIQSQLKANSLHGASGHVFATGKKQLATPNPITGEPQFETTYSIVGNSPEVTVDPDNLKFLNAYSNKTLKDGQTLPGTIYGALNQQATNAKSSADSINRDRANAGEDPLSASEIKDNSQFLSDWTGFLANTKSPREALKALQQNPDFVKKYPNAGQLVSTMYGGVEPWNKIGDTYDAKIDADKQTAAGNALLLKSLNAVENDPKALNETTAGSASVMFQNKIDDPETPDYLKKRLVAAKKQADQVLSKLSTDSANKISGDEKARSAASGGGSNAKLANGDWDPTSIPVSLVDGFMDPSQLSKRSKDYNEKLQQANAYSLQKYGKPFDIAQAQSDYKYANNAATQNTLKYLNSVIPNMSSLVNQSNAIGRTNFPAINNAEMWAKLESGNDAVAAYATTVTEVSDQIAKILQGGGTGSGSSDAKLKQAQDLFDQGFSSDQIKAVVGSLSPLLESRKNAIIGDNRYLQKQYGKPPAQTSIPQGATVANGPGGHQIYSVNNGPWMDATTGKPVGAQ